MLPYIEGALHLHAALLVVLVLVDLLLLSLLKLVHYMETQHDVQ